MGINYTGNAPTLKYLYQKNQDYFNNILTQLKKHTIVPLLGAGFSATAYPGWSKLYLS